MKKMKKRFRLISLLMCAVIVMTSISFDAIEVKAADKPDFTVSFNVAPYSDHGARAIPVQEFDTTDMQDGDTLYNRFVAPADPVATDGAKFLFWYFETTDGGSDGIPTYTYRDVIDLENTSDLYGLGSICNYYKTGNTSIELKAAWDTDATPDKGFVILGDEDFSYVFHDDASYTTNNPIDTKSGTYTDFVVVNITDHIIDFDVLAMKDSLSSGQPSDSAYGKWAVGLLGELNGVPNTKALVFTYTHELNYVSVVPASKPIISFDTEGLFSIPSYEVDTLDGANTYEPDAASWEKYGYKLDGWYTDDTYQTEWDFDTANVTEDTTIYGKFSIAEFNVTFDACGGNINGQASITKKYNSAMTYGNGEDLPVPERDGYVFKGWSLKTRDSSYKYIVEKWDKITECKDHTIYAVWSKSGQCRVSFEYEDSFLGRTITERWYDPGEALGELPSVPQNYELIGYHEAGSDEYITPETIINSQVVYYAKVKAVSRAEKAVVQYYVFDENNNPSLYAYKIYPLYEKFRLPKEPVGPNGEKLLFWGVPNLTFGIFEAIDFSSEEWSDKWLDKGINSYTFYAVFESDAKASKGYLALGDKDCKYVILSGKGEFEYFSNNESDEYGINKRVFLYAKCRDIYFVDRQGKLMDEDPVKAKCTSKAEVMSFGEELYNMYSREDETFNVKDIGCLTLDYKADTGYLQPDFHRTYVMFDTDELCDAPEDQFIDDDETVVKPEDPKADGYIFEGWYEDPDFETEYDFASMTPVGKLTIYGKFSPLPSVTVSFNGNGGTIDGKASVEKQIRIDKNYGTLPTPVREGYKFLGWALTKDGKDYITEDDKLSIAKGHTVYASWEEDKKDPDPTPGPDPDPTPGPDPDPTPGPKPDPDGKIEIKFNPNGGKSDKEIIKVVPGKPGELPKAEKKNVVFGGWKDENGKLVTDLSTVSGNALLTASWENITVIAKQKVDITSFFADAKKAYIDKKKAETELAGKKFKEKNVKYRYRVLNKDEFAECVSMNSVANSASQGKASANGKGLLNCKKSGIIAIKLQFKEKVGKKSQWIDAPGSDILFIAIEKPVAIKGANKTLKYIGETVSLNSIIGYEMADKIGNMPNYAEYLITSSKPSSVSVNALTGEITAVANGKSKIQLSYKTPISVSKKGKVKYSNVKVSFTINVKSPEFKKAEVNLKAGKSKKLSLKNVTKKTPVTWSSDNESVATVVNGRVKAVGSGTATIKAVIDGRAYTCKVNVK